MMHEQDFLGELGQRLKAIRRSLKKSQADMAAYVGCSQKSWQIWESGQNFPGGRTLFTLESLGYSVDWLFTGVGPMRRTPSGRMDSPAYPSEAQEKTLKRLIVQFTTLSKAEHLRFPPEIQADMIIKAYRVVLAREARGEPTPIQNIRDFLDLINQDLPSNTST